MLGCRWTSLAAGLCNVEVAQAKITPEGPMRLSGYEANRMAEGNVHNLRIKALALEDSEGKRALLLSTDLIGIDRPL
jgi:hypothetical protein